MNTIKKRADIPVMPRGTKKRIADAFYLAIAVFGDHLDPKVVRSPAAWAKTARKLREAQRLLREARIIWP